MEQEVNYQKLIDAQKKEEEKYLNMKAEVVINGQNYRLRFDLYAFEQIEEQYGGLREAFKALNSGKVMQNVKKLFAILANSQRNADGMPEDVTGEEIPKHGSVNTLLAISEAIKAAIYQGRRAETADGGPASDKKANPLEKEYEAKNG